MVQGGHHGRTVSRPKDARKLPAFFNVAAITLGIDADFGFRVSG